MSKQGNRHVLRKEAEFAPHLVTAGTKSYMT